MSTQQVTSILARDKKTGATGKVLRQDKGWVLIQWYKDGVTWEKPSALFLEGGAAI